MKLSHLRTARTVAVLVFGVSVGSAAWADCAEELAQLTGGISKDGSLAPMQTGEATMQSGGDAATAETESEGTKDGTMAPMGTDPALATSVEDAQAQQQGGATAAEQAAGESGSSETTGRAEALAEAQAALAGGNEAGCMSAVEEAKGM